MPLIPIEAALRLLTAIVELAKVINEHESPEHRKLREEIEMVGMRLVLQVLKALPVPG